MPRGASSADDDAIEYIAIGASCPWNLSTVPTRAPVGKLAASASTCALYGATIRMSASVIGLLSPCLSVQVLPSAISDPPAMRSARPLPPKDAAIGRHGERVKALLRPRDYTCSITGVVDPAILG